MTKELEENEKIKFDEIKNLIDVILYLITLAIGVFCVNETFGSIPIDEPNLYGMMAMLSFMVIWASVKSEASYLLIIPILCFVFIVMHDFTEITKEQYEKISKIDKNIIINTIGNKTYINNWDYRNILETSYNNARNRNIEKDESEKNDIRNKILKKD